MSTNVQFLNTRTGEITARAYLGSITEIVSDCQQKGRRALLIRNNYVLVLLWGKQCFFLFDSHGKDKIGRMSATDAAFELSFKIHFAINMQSVAKLLAHRRRKRVFKNWKAFFKFSNVILSISNIFANNSMQWMSKIWI